MDLHDPETMHRICDAIGNLVEDRGFIIVITDDKGFHTFSNLNPVGAHSLLMYLAQEFKPNASKSVK